MTTTTERAGGQPQVIAGTALIRDAIDIMRSRLPAIGYAWIALLAATLLSQLAVSNAGIAFASPQDPAYLAYRLATVLGAGIAGALVMRLLFEDDARGLLRIDRPLIECAGLFALAQLLVTAVSTFAAVKGLESGDEQVAALWSMGAGGVALILYYVFAKLLLLPIARLDGRNDITIGRAWRLMRRTVRSYFGAALLISIPLMVPVLAASIILRPTAQDIPPAFSVIGAVAGATMSIVGHSLALAIYRRRVGADRKIPDVFD